MTLDDLDEFTALLDAVCAMLSRGKYMPNETSTTIFFRAMAPYTMAQFRAALQAHVDDPKRGMFPPVPADIHAQVQGLAADDGRPGAEEAWAMVRRADDENVTLVWTAEMAEAFGLARPLLQEGEDVGARMAFKEAYGRMVDAARAAGRAPSWTVTLGKDKAARNDVLLPHVQAGRISAELLIEHAPVQGLDGLLALPAPEGESEASRNAREQALASLRETRERIATRQSEADRIEAEEKAAFQRELAEKEAQTAARNNTKENP